MLTLPSNPEKPLKGKGHAREHFPFDRRLKSDKEMAEFWDSLPRHHKTEVATRRRQKGYFHFERFISPEAAKVWADKQQEGEK